MVGILAYGLKGGPKEEDTSRAVRQDIQKEIITPKEVSKAKCFNITI